MQHRNQLRLAPVFHSNVASVVLYSFYWLQVFVDEINTSSCLGVLKEIVIDKTLDGKVNHFMRDKYNQGLIEPQSGERACN